MKKNSNIQKSKKSKKEYGKKKDATASLNIALTKLQKESKKPKGILDKIKKEKKEGTVAEKNIKSVMVLKRNCSRLMNHLHQMMHHSLAIKVHELTTFIEDNISARAMDKIIDELDKISRKHGFDFFKP